MTAPRKEDYYYRAIPGRFLDSVPRWQLTAAQWGRYRDLIDLLYANDGALPYDERFLMDRARIESKTDFDAIMKHHFYQAEDGRLRHRIVDAEIDSRAQSRRYFEVLGEKSGEARRSRSPKRTSGRRRKSGTSVQTDAFADDRTLNYSLNHLHKDVSDTRRQRARTPSTRPAGAARSGASPTGATGLPPEPAPCPPEIREQLQADLAKLAGRKMPRPRKGEA